MTQQRCYYHPLRRVRTRYSVGAKYFYCSGLQEWEARCTACTACWRTDICEGRMRFVLFCPSGIVPAQFEALSTGSVCNITCIRTEEELRNKLRHRPQSVVISAGRPAECAEMWFRFYRDHHSWWCCASRPFSATGCEYFWRSQKPEVTENRNVSRACYQCCKCLWWVFRTETCRKFASYGQLLCLYE